MPHHFTRGKKLLVLVHIRLEGEWARVPVWMWWQMWKSLSVVGIEPWPLCSSVHFSELEKGHPFLQEMAQVRQVVSSYEMFIHKATEEAGGVILQNFIFGHFFTVWLLRLIPGINVEIKCQLRCNRGFYCNSCCLLNMFWAPLCPSSGAQEYYTVVAACGISCCGFQVVGSGVELRVMCPVCRMLQHPANRTHNPQLMGIVVPETCWASNKICNKNLCCI